MTSPRQLACSQRRNLILGLLALGYLAVLLGSSVDAWRPWLPIGGAVALGAMVWAWRLDGFSLRWVLVVALLLRVAMLPMPPSLSSDIYRYLWDGSLVLQGINPYQFAPSDSSLAELQTLGLFGKFNSPDYYSVYPPVMQAFFAVAALGLKLGFGAAYLLMKLLVGTCELGALWVLARWIAPRHLLLYAWNPFVLVETWGQPHGEAIAIGALAATLWFLSRRPGLAVFFLTLAVWTKLWPALLFPFIWRHLGWHWRYLAVAGGTTLVLWLPFASLDTFQNFGQSLRLYTNLLEWNAGIYELLYLIRWGITRLLWASELLPLDAGHGRIVGPLLRLALLAGTGAVFWWGRGWPLLRQLATVTVLCIASLSVIHPWYLVPVFWLLPFFSRVEWSWLFLGLTSAGTYMAYTQGIYWPFVIVGWAGWLFLLAYPWRKTGKPPFSALRSDVRL